MIIIRIDSGSDPNPSTNSGEITYNINGLDKHILTASGLGINVHSWNQPDVINIGLIGNNEGYVCAKL